MKKALPIFVAILLMRFKSLLRLARNVASRVGILRLGVILLKAAWFQLQLSRIVRKPERLMLTSGDSRERSMNLACASVARAELTAATQGIEELWYDFQAARDSSALEHIQDLFAVVFLSARMKSFSLRLASTPSLPFADLRLATLSGDETAEVSTSAPSVTVLRDADSCASILTKPFFQSEIAPNDYLKRVADGRKVALVSISEDHFRSFWCQLLGNIQNLAGEEAGPLFVLLDRVSIPGEPPLPAGMDVQLLGVLGFTSLERLALAGNVDLLITDRAPYILSALAKNPTIIAPVCLGPGRSASSGHQQMVLFKVSRPVEGGREAAEVAYDTDNLNQPNQARHGN